MNGSYAHSSSTALVRCYHRHPHHLSCAMGINVQSCSSIHLFLFTLFLSHASFVEALNYFGLQQQQHPIPIASWFYSSSSSSTRLNYHGACASIYHLLHLQYSYPCDIIVLRTAFVPRSSNHTRSPLPLTSEGHHLLCYPFTTYHRGDGSLLLLNGQPPVNLEITAFYGPA